MPPRTFDQTLAAAAAVGERFDLAVSWIGPDVDRLQAAALSDDQIEHGITLRGAGLRTTDRKIAAVMWLQWYSYRIAAPLLASWVLHRRLPDVSAANIAFRYDAEGRPAFIAMNECRGYGLAGDSVDDVELIHVPDLLPAIVSILLDGHLLPLASRVQARYRLGRPIIRGTVASQIGMALTFLDAHCRLPWEQVAADSIALLEFTKPLIDGQGRSGDVICTESGGRAGMTFRRGTCCTVYRATGDAEMCGGCPLQSDEHRAGVWADRLAARPAWSFT